MGFTLIELMVAVAIVAILAQLAAPAMQDLIDRRRLIGAAEAVYSLVQAGRSEAVKQSAALRVTASAGTADNWWVGLRLGAVDCTGSAGAAPCQILENNVAVTKLVAAADFPGVALTAQTLSSPAVNTTGVTYGERGFIPAPLPTTETEFKLTSQRGLVLNVRINQVGNIRICADSSNPWGYSSCS